MLKYSTEINFGGNAMFKILVVEDDKELNNKAVLK